MELMIVVAIIGTLSAIAVMSAKGTRNKARMSIFYGYVHDVKQAALHFKNDNGFFPPDVYRGVDPALISREGYADGNHSATWESADLSGWNGPYLPFKSWPANPWGGYFDYDFLPEGYEYGGVSRPGLYLSAKPKWGAGREGLPPVEFEEYLQKQGVDRAEQLGHIAIFLCDPDEAAAVTASN